MFLWLHYDQSGGPLEGNNASINCGAAVMPNACPDFWMRRGFDSEVLKEAFISILALCVRLGKER